MWCLFGMSGDDSGVCHGQGGAVVDGSNFMVFTACDKVGLALEHCCWSVMVSSKP